MMITQPQRDAILTKAFIASKASAVFDYGPLAFSVMYEIAPYLSLQIFVLLNSIFQIKLKEC